MSGVVRPLGEVLTGLPVGVAAPGWSCGPTFAWDPAPGLRASGLLRRAAGVLGAASGGPRRLVLIAENLVLAAELDR